MPEMESTPKETRRAAIYCRASKKDPSSLRIQERDLRAWAKAQGFEIVAVMKEEPHGTFEQKKVLALAKRRKIEAILVTTTDVWSDTMRWFNEGGLDFLTNPRFLRQQMFLFEGLDRLARLHIPILSMTGGLFNWSTTEGQKWAAMAAEQVRSRQDWKPLLIKAGMREAKEEGRAIGRSKGPSEKTSKVTPKILRLRAQGLSYRAIAEATGLDPKTIASVVKSKAN